MAGPQEELCRRAVHSLVALAQVAAAVIHILRHIHLNAAEGINDLGQRFQPDGQIAVHMQAKNVIDLIGQRADVVAAVGTLRFGNGVDLVVAGEAGIRGNKDVARDLQHLDLAGLIVEVQVQNHVGHAVIYLRIGFLSGLGGAVNAHHQQVELFARILFGGVDQLVQADGPRRRCNGVHDKGDRAEKDHSNGQQGAQQHLPPAAFFLFLAVRAIGACAAFAFAAAALGRFATAACGRFAAAPACGGFSASGCRFPGAA